MDCGIGSGPHCFRECLLYSSEQRQEWFVGFGPEIHDTNIIIVIFKPPQFLHIVAHYRLRFTEAFQPHENFRTEIVEGNEGTKDGDMRPHGQSRSLHVLFAKTLNPAKLGRKRNKECCFSHGFSNDWRARRTLCARGAIHSRPS